MGKRTDWRFLTSVTGVIHIGAHNGEERQLYDRANLAVLWIEALPREFDTLTANLADYPRQTALNALLTDRDGDVYQFNVSSNSGLSSSIFEFADHRDIWPSVTMIDTLALTSTTFATLAERHNISIAAYQAVVLDVQGAELLVLKGFGDLLAEFRFVKAEAADFEGYKGGATVRQLDDLLRPFGFIETARVVQARHPRHGTYWDVVWERMSPRDALRHGIGQMLGPRVVSLLRRVREGLRLGR